ncbi:MAG: hypothetical protein K2G44_03315 [Clostridia bacterium]|nr:hypothetical protein [Clostridia bacterium]MDE6677004.1 hypothetical protein [Clostridia bacterium]
MKKRFIAAGLALTGAMFFACTGCGNNSAALSSAQDVYGMGAVSTVKLLGSEIAGGAVKSLSAVVSTAAETGGAGEDTVKAQADKFNEYFNMLDSFLGEDLVSTTAVKNTDEAYADYETKLTINGRDLDGEKVTYVMYYTETHVRTTVDKDEKKEEYTLVGVMVMDGGDYALRGEREYETERGETENELRIRAYPDIADKTTYVQMEQENSEETGETEQEYVYSVYQNGTLVEKTAVEFETERKGNKEEVEYELEFLQGSAKGKYKVEKETKNGVVEMKVKYTIDGKSGTFRIRQTKDGYEYTFSDNTQKVYKN